MLLTGLFLAGCSSDSPGPTGSDSRSTWGIIQEDIFASRCTGCHTAGTSFARQSGLVLTPDVAYQQLVGAEPANAAARADGLLRVSDREPGLPSLYKSYLWEKINAPDQEHFYSDHPYYGALMPLGGDPLTNGELAFIRAWIEAGAPETGAVVDAALLDDDRRYERPDFQPLREPENGIQLHLGPFEVPPRFEREFFFHVPLENEEDLFVERFEISMQSGSHHFILYTFEDDIPAGQVPPPREYRELRDASGEYIGATIGTMLYHLPAGHRCGLLTRQPATDRSPKSLFMLAPPHRRSTGRLHRRPTSTVISPSFLRSHRNSSLSRCCDDCLNPPRDRRML